MDKRYRYVHPSYKSITYTVNDGSGTVDLTQFLNQLHSTQLDYIDEALEKSDLKEANDVIAYIKGKINNEPQV
jgi:hypothetical protein